MKICMYCNKEFASERALNGHLSQCEINPTAKRNMYGLNGISSSVKRRNESPGESYFRNELNKNNVVFVQEYPVKRYRLDFVSLKNKVALEVNGRQHYSPAGIARDEKRDAYLKKLGYEILHVDWEGFNKSSVEEQTGTLKRIIDKFNNTPNSRKVQETSVRSKKRSSPVTKFDIQPSWLVLEYLSTLDEGTKFTLSDIIANAKFGSNVITGGLKQAIIGALRDAMRHHAVSHINGSKPDFFLLRDRTVKINAERIKGSGYKEVSLQDVADHCKARSASTEVSSTDEFDFDFSSLTDAFPTSVAGSTSLAQSKASVENINFDFDNIMKEVSTLTTPKQERVEAVSRTISDEDVIDYIIAASDDKFNFITLMREKLKEKLKVMSN